MALFASPPSPRSLRILLSLGGSAGVGLLAVLAACIVADPPAELPAPPNLPPRIVQGSVYPPTSRVLRELPDEFLVPVELVDPSQAFFWEVFLDFDPFQNVLPVAGRQVTPDPTALDAGTRVVAFSLTTPLDPSSCHVIEFLVALSFDSAYPHTTNPPGGDGVVWFYNPSGDLGGCPVYDAGAAADGAFPSDGGSDVLLLQDTGGTE